MKLSMHFQVLENKLENEMDLNNKAREPDEDFKVQIIYVIKF